MALSTHEMMRIALELVGQDEVPPDSCIYVPSAEVNRVLAAIDLGPAEMLMAVQLGCDCVLAHHPAPGLQTFWQILDLHVLQMIRAGVPEDVARDAVRALKEVRRWAAHSGNWLQLPAVARRLGLAYLNVHNPADELGRRRLQAAVDALPPEASVGDLVAALEDLEDIRIAPTQVEVALGNAGNRAGRVVVSHGAGTNGGYPIAKAYFDHGVDTVVYIHIAAGELERLRREFANEKNLVVTGHIASDLLGFRPYVEALRARGLEVIGLGF